MVPLVAMALRCRRLAPQFWSWTKDPAHVKTTLLPEAPTVVWSKRASSSQLSEASCSVGVPATARRGWVVVRYAC